MTLGNMDGEKWQVLIWGNTYEAYTHAVFLFVIVGLVSAFVHLVVLRRIERIAQNTSTDVDDFAARIIGGISPASYLALCLFVATATLEVVHIWERAFFLVVIVLGAWQVMRLIDIIIEYFVHKRLDGREQTQGLQSAIDLLATLIKAALWVTAGLLVLSNFGVNITALVASMGIGGIAIAFAIKGILEDLFSSFSIYLDKPFVVGDAIAVDGEKGTVKKIGIKTTRLKSLTTGEEIVMANTDLTTKKIHNFHKMTKRRVSFDIGVTYETPTKTLKEITGMVQGIIESQDHTDFSRAHFRSFDDSALTFSFLYYIDSREYDVYLQTHENILFAMRDIFEEKNIEMAYPTQTIHLQKTA